MVICLVIKGSNYLPNTLKRTLNSLNIPLLGTLLYERKIRKMSQLSEIWRVNGGETSRVCPKYGFIVTGCTRYFECDKCVGKKRVVPVKKKEKIKPVKKTKKHIKKGKKRSK